MSDSKKYLDEIEAQCLANPIAMESIGALKHSLKGLESIIQSRGHIIDRLEDLLRHRTDMLETEMEKNEHFNKHVKSLDDQLKYDLIMENFDRFKTDEIQAFIDGGMIFYEP